MSGHDVIPFPGTSYWGRRVIVEAWLAAGSPRLNDGGRLYGQQKYFYDGYRQGLPGFNPADNPDDETQALGHLRFVAIDVDPTPERIRRLTAAGLVRPFWWESWHWAVPNVFAYSIVHALPTPKPPAKPEPPKEEDDMIALRIDHKGIKHHALVGVGVFRHLIGADDPERRKNVHRADDVWLETTLYELPVLLRDHGCDLQIWDIQNGSLVVLDPLTGSVAPGNVWTAENARYADIMRQLGAKLDKITITSEQTAEYLEDLARDREKVTA